MQPESKSDKLAIIRMLFTTGCRSIEIKGLYWELVDLERRILIVGKSKTDAGTGRPIPMNTERHAILSVFGSLDRVAQESQR